MEIDKLFEKNSIDSVADNVFGVVNNSVSEVREMQRKKVAENVQLIVNALKKIEEDIREKYDSVSSNLEKRIISIKDGRDGINGRDGKDGKDGKPGKDGRPGRDGKDGKNGSDGADGKDGISVLNAHIDFDGSLIISLSSGKEINVGEVVAPDLAEKIKVITNGGGTSQSVLDTLTSLQSQIDALSGATIYKGLWNASTNTPALTSSVGTSGNFYIVSVAGSTSLDGITNWGVGDWAIFNGSVWQRVEGGAAGNFTTVTASSLTSGRVTYAGAGGLLQDSSNLTFNGTTLTSAGFSGPLNGTVGATTPNTGAFTTLSATGDVTLGDASTDTVTVTGYMGVGSAGTTARGIYVRNSALTGTTPIGIESRPTFPITATNSGYGFYAAPATTAASFTLSNIYGMAIADATKGAGSTITNQIGLRVNDQTNGTNNYGIVSQVSSGADKWNIYASGTADSYFAGNVQFAAGTAAAPALTRFGDTNTGIFFPAADTIAFTEGGAEAMRIDSSGNVGIGTASPVGKLAVNGISNFGTGFASSDIANTRPLYVRSSDNNSLISFQSSSTSGDGFMVGMAGAEPRLQVTNNLPLVVFTNNTERMRIDSSGNVGIGGTSFGSGAVVLFMANATTAPTTNPTGGGILYVEGGALKYRGSSGTVTTIANA